MNFIWTSQVVNLPTNFENILSSIFSPINALNILVMNFEDTVKPLYSGHHQDRVKVSAIRSCPLNRDSKFRPPKLVFSCFAHLSIKSPTKPPKEMNLWKV